MNWDAIGAIAELISALAVIITLVYLAIQIRQGRDAINLQTLLAIESDKVARRSALTRDVAVALSRLNGSKDPEVSADTILAASFVRTGLRMSENELRLYLGGVIPRETWDARLLLDVTILSDPNQPFVREIYEQEKSQGLLMAEYQRLVEAKLDEMNGGT